MGAKVDKFKGWWRRLKGSSKFHNALMFLLFVFIAAFFWFIIVLNSSVMETFRVKLNIYNVPDSVTFINDPPSNIHVTLRDKGTNILRSAVLKDPRIDLNFQDYSHDGIFRLSHLDLNSELKTDLGGSVQVSAVSIDSLRLYYTTQPGRRVPVVVQADLHAASGYIIPGPAVPLTKAVQVYSYGDEIDTVHTVRTAKLVKSDLSQTAVFEVKLLPIPHVKIVPSQIKVQVPVEPLVHKEAYVSVEVEGLPKNTSLLLFPNKVPVSFYVPMSHFNDEMIPIRVVVDYEETLRTKGSKISLKIADHAPGLVNVSLKADSVDYTLVRH